MSKSLTNFHLCDFETTTLADDCRVWGWASCSITNTDNITMGNNIESFIDFSSSKKKMTIFFHNLKFDGGFIDNWLLHDGYQVISDKKYLVPKSFTTTISGMGQWYAINIMFENGNKCVIYDSLKKLPFRVKEIAKAFKLSMAKGSIDYEKTRPVNYLLTENEKDYIRKDVKIVAEALKIQYEEGMDGMTVSKDCLNDYIATIGGENRFRNLFPILSDEVHNNLKLAYRGGWVYVKESIASRVLGRGVSYDFNSLYPSRMKDCLMPYGLPIPFKGKYNFIKSYPLHIQHIQCEFQIKNDHLPTIQIKGSEWGRYFKASEYLDSSRGMRVDLYLTNIDLELFFDHYEVFNLDYIDGYMFKAKHGMFDKYIDKHNFVKMQSDGANRALAKLKMNGLYGKFGSDLDVTGKLPYLKDDGSTGYRKKSLRYIEKDGKEVLYDDMDLHDYQEAVYIPVAIFTTSYGRDLTIRSAQSVYKRFCYADTDSIHLTGTTEPKNFKDIIHPYKLGYLKRESIFVKAKFLRAKTYMEEICIKYIRNEDGSLYVDPYGDNVYKETDIKNKETTILSVKCAGLDDQAKPFVTFDNFYIGSHIKVPEHAMKLRPKHVKGGIVLERKEINIREQFFNR